ncbi:NfeD family protein [Hafnia alvei]|uniref:NfeD family protein n=1 Tax=Hafnia alvei TaxID=569 RepID=UPI001F3B9DE8|nr:NfeD family protein [Hafnia alvei]MCE9870610.1 NfeD family protein [Hafnia alvei]
MIDYIAQNPHGFWLSLGGVLLAAELLGAGGYLLWCGISALLVGLLTWVLPFGWEWQATLFAILTVATALLWWHWLRRSQPVSRNNDDLLNQRSRQLIGARATLEAPIVNGNGRIRIGDSSWRVTCSQELPLGAVVEVIDVEGITLVVKSI